MPYKEPSRLTSSRTSDLSYGRNQEPSPPYLQPSSSASFSKKSFASSTVPLYLRLRFSPVHSLTMLIFQLYFCIFFSPYILSPLTRGRHRMVAKDICICRFIHSQEGQTHSPRKKFGVKMIHPLVGGADT